MEQSIHVSSSSQISLNSDEPKPISLTLLSEIAANIIENTNKDGYGEHIVLE